MPTGISKVLVKSADARRESSVKVPKASRKANERNMSGMLAQGMP